MCNVRNKPYAYDLYYINIEDIYSFAVNTINIVIECNVHKCEALVKIWMFSLHEMKIFYGIHWKRVNFLFILLFTRQCVFLTS